MAFERPMIGEPTPYNGHIITVRYCGPDLLCYVDGSELNGFYVDIEAARKAGMRHCDHIDKERKK